MNDNVAKKVLIKNLELDFDNPRLINSLPKQFKTLNDEQKEFYIIVNLILTNKIVEMVEQMLIDLNKTRLLLSSDRIIVVENKKEQYIVKEGNRRTLSLKLIGDNNLADNILSSVHQYNGNWLTSSQKKEIIEKLNKIKSNIDTRLKEDFIDNVDVFIVGKDDAENLNFLLNELHVNSKETWKSADKASFQTLMLQKYIKDNEIEDFDNAAYEFHRELTINVGLTKFKNNVRKSMIHDMVSNYLISKNMNELVSKFNEKTLPIVDTLYTRMKNDFDFEFNLFINESFSLDLSIQQKFNGNKNLMVIEPEELFCELATIILEHNVSNTKFNSQIYFEKLDEHEPIGMIRIKQKIDEYLINKHSHEKDVVSNSVDNDDRHDPTSPTKNETSTSSNSITSPKITQDKYIPFKLLHTYSFNKNLGVVNAEKITKEIRRVFDIGEDAIYNYKFLISLSIRTVYELYLLRISEMGFFESLKDSNILSVSEHEAKNFIKENSTTTAKIKILDAMFFYICLNNNSIDLDFNDYWGIDNNNNLNKFLTKCIMTENGCSQSTIQFKKEEFDINNVNNKTELIFARKFNPLHSVLHFDPDLLTSSQIEQHLDTLEGYIMLCEFIMYSGKSYVSKYFTGGIR